IFGLFIMGPVMVKLGPLFQVRCPVSGNPEQGGNFILSAHRYVFALLPQQVSKQSVLYNIDKLELSDDIFIDWQGKRYSYKVSEKRTVKPSETTIELASKISKLTLYSCTREGQNDGRKVIVATPQG
ncbi:sortase, partial [Candidatus Saccharibacteria bacterium]|nr:sortase [Candidatus Saccharibacteria bacterium]